MNCEYKKNMRSYGRSMGGLTGGLTGGLENVKSLIKNELTLKTGGLAENEECRMKNEESLLDNEKFTIHN